MIGLESTGKSGRDAHLAAQAGGADETDEAVDVLRAVWTTRGQTNADLDELFGPAKTCKNMRNVGFDELGTGDGGLREAWRATLEREGKLSKDPGSVRDLVFGDAEPGSR